MRRAPGSLRRLLRGRRAPKPSEQEWLRLILLVRRLQRGQLAFAQRLDEIRALTGALGSFRSDFAALHEQLGAARESAGELERGLTQRLAMLDGLPDAGEERAALDRRVRALDALTARLETIAGQVPSARSPHALDGALARFDALATRLETAQAAERAVGGLDELARLYERIQELAEGMAGARAGSVGESAVASDENLERFGHQVERFEAAVQELAVHGGASAHEEALARLELLATRLERGRAAPGGAKELGPVLARFEALAERLEKAPAALPELPADAVASPDPSVARANEELRVSLLCEQESRRRLDAELEALRERLRSSELARVELETRHTTELAQVADHVGRQLQRVEEDLKKKKRGLAELTQQNISLQAQLSRLQGGDPEAPLPHAKTGTLTHLMQPEPDEAPAKEEA